MPLDQVANFVAAETTADIGSGDTTIPVSDAAAFPDPGNGEYPVVIDEVEVVRVTGRDTTGDTLTVQRGQEDSSAVSHDAPVSVELNITAGLLEDLDVALEELADFSASPTEVTAPINSKSATIGEAGSADTGPSERDLVTNGTVSVTVDAGGGGDYTSVQAAVNDIPFYVKNEYNISVTDGTYNEDVVIPPFITGHAVNNGEVGKVELNGNRTTPANCKVTSILGSGCLGYNGVRLYGFEIQDINPYTNENAGIGFYSSVFDVADISFIRTNAGFGNSIGVSAYSSIGNVSGDIDPNNAKREYLFQSKSGSMLATHNVTNPTAADKLCRLDGSYFSFDSSTASFVNDIPVVGVGGYAVDLAENAIHGPTSFAQGLDIENVDNIGAASDFNGSMAIDEAQEKLYLKDDAGNIGYINLDGTLS